MKIYQTSSPADDLPFSMDDDFPFSMEDDLPFSMDDDLPFSMDDDLPFSVEDDLPFPMEDPQSRNEEIIKEKEMMIEQLNAKIHRLKHDLFYLWIFLGMEEMLEEAYNYLDDHMDGYAPTI